MHLQVRFPKGQRHEPHHCHSHLSTRYSIYNIFYNIPISDDSSPITHITIFHSRPNYIEPQTHSCFIYSTRYKPTRPPYNPRAIHVLFTPIRLYWNSGFAFFHFSEDEMEGSRVDLGSLCYPDPGNRSRRPLRTKSRKMNQIFRVESRVARKIELLYNARVEFSGMRTLGKRTFRVSSVVRRLCTVRTFSRRVLESFFFICCMRASGFYL